MDPITRRSVWDIIEAAKGGRAIVLTTHSMEEADILSDRLAIMARGRIRFVPSLPGDSECTSGVNPSLLNFNFNWSFEFGFRCLGTSIHLKSKFGAGYKVSVGVERAEEGNEENVEKIKQFFKERLGVESEGENKAYISFLVPRTAESKLAVSSFLPFSQSHLPRKPNFAVPS